MCFTTADTVLTLVVPLQCLYLAWNIRPDTPRWAVTMTDYLIIFLAGLLCGHWVAYYL